MCTTLLLTLSVLGAEKPSVATDEIINTVKILEIANGDENGNMNFNKNVTRAEFIKMAVSCSVNKDRAKNNFVSYSLFPDVKSTYWAAGYISIAIQNGLVNGYLDGTFKPANYVTLEEAATIALRLLGYTSDDFKGSYPSSQLEKYYELDLDENLSAKQGQKLSREECMILLYNTLCAKTKSGSIYCTSLGYQTDSNQKIDYSALLEKTLDGPAILSNGQSIEDCLEFAANSQTAFYLNNYPSNKSEIKSGDVVYCSDKINVVFAFRKTASGVVSSFSSDGTVSLAGSKSFKVKTSKAKNKLSIGGEFNGENAFVTLILGLNDEVVDITDGNIFDVGKNDNDSSYSDIVSSTIKGPYIVTSEGKADMLTIDVNTAKLLYQNKEIKVSELLPYDVYYFSNILKTVWIYRNAISGTIEETAPSVAPTSVTLSGKTYQIESSQASYDLSSFGKFGVGDKVTLLLGMDNKVCGVTSTDVLSKIYYGVVTGRGSKEFTESDGTKYTSDYITVTDLDCNIYTYEHSTRGLGVGDIVRVSVGETVKLTEQVTSFGRADYAKIVNAINNKNFSDNCRIIEIKDSNVKKVYTSRFEGAKLDLEAFLYSSYILYYNTDNEGNLTELVLNNYTGDLLEYGVVTNSGTSQITYMTSNSKKTASNQAVTCPIGPCAIYTDNGSLSSIKPLTGVVEEVDLITKSAVYDTRDKEYFLSDNVKVFFYSAGTYKYITLDDAIAGNYTYKAYFDKAPEKGGRIRVIIASNA